MRKSILAAIIVLVVLLVFTTGCKKLRFDDLTWYSLEGRGSYSSQTDTSSIRLSGFVALEQPRIARYPISAEIADWQYLLLEGDIPLMVIGPENFVSIMGDRFPSISGNEENFLWVQLQGDAIPGDIYNGASPDTMSLSLIIVDSEGNPYEMNGMATFEFTRD